MPDLIIHTIDGRRNIWHNAPAGWLQVLNSRQSADLVRLSDDDPVIRVGAIASIDIVKEGKE